MLFFLQKLSQSCSWQVMEGVEDRGKKNSNMFVLFRNAKRENYLHVVFILMNTLETGCKYLLTSIIKHANQNTYSPPSKSKNSLRWYRRQKLSNKLYALLIVGLRVRNCWNELLKSICRLLRSLVLIVFLRS